MKLTINVYIKSTSLLFVLLICCTSLSAQSNFWDSKDAYLGQSPPNDTPKIFAKNLIVDTGSWAGDRVAFSQDGKEFYYARAKSWFTTQNRLEYYKYIDGKWQGPLLLAEHCYAPTFSKDDQTIYLQGRGKGSVWQTHRTKDGWTDPEPYLQKKVGLYDFMPTLGGNMYAASNVNQGDINNWSTYNFCRITISGNDTTIKSLGVPLNAPGFNGDFYVAPDESYMIISDKETKDFKAELYISFRKADDTWTNPKSLGPLINNGLADRWGQYVSPDHKYLFYTQGTGPKSCYVYWVRFDTMLAALKHSNFEPYVKTPLNDQSAKTGEYYSYQIPADTFIDDDGDNTLTYKAMLADGKELPDGLKFDRKTQSLKGSPKTAGKYQVQVTATDPQGASASSTFSLDVK